MLFWFVRLFHRIVIHKLTSLNCSVHCSSPVFMFSLCSACVWVNGKPTHTLLSVFDVILVADHQWRQSGSRERRVTISALPPMPMHPSPNIIQKQEKRGPNLTTVRWCKTLRERIHGRNIPLVCGHILSVISTHLLFCIFVFYLFVLSYLRETNVILCGFF